ncbi:MAG: response regulator [Gemmatimonadetes bacterium]|nr:response regulator [Gemmatimonadota bacterium]
MAASSDPTLTGEAGFRHMADAAPFPVWMLNPAGRVTWCNKRYAELVGRTVSEVVQAGLIPDAHEEDREALATAIADGVTARAQFTCEYRMRRVDGEYPLVLATASPRFDGAGQFAGFLGSSADVASRDVADRQREDDERLAAVQRLAGGVAHEFNNLLTQIKVGAELVLAELAPQAPGRADVESISHAADRASVLARQLLAFGRRQMLRAEPIDLEEEVQAQIESLRLLAGPQIAVSLQLAGVRGAVRADREQLGQVLRALVTNARDAMPTGGVVTITTTAMTATGGEIGPSPTLKAGPYLRLTVGDNGPGMDEEAKAHAFEPFFTTRSREQHPGLGLSTVYGVIQQSGGSVWIDSGARQGTRVHLFCPLEATAPTAATRRPSLTPAFIRRDAVLLVEDDDAVRTLACRVLQRRGYREHVASDGTEGLDMWQRLKHEVALVISDVVMPGVSGRDLVLEVRKTRPRMPIILMSGYVGESLETTEGLNPLPIFLEKPFTVASLGEAVQRALAVPEGAEGIGIIGL